MPERVDVGQVHTGYVLSRRLMRVLYDDQVLRRYFEVAETVSDKHPVLIDQFLEDAVGF